MSEPTNLLETLRAGDENALRLAYLDHRDGFLRWARSLTHAAEPDLLDLYQDTLVVFYQNLTAGKIQHLDSGVAPYLFGIGKKLIVSRRWRTRREISFDPADELFLRSLTVPGDDEPEQIWKPIFKKALDRMNETCQKIIEWFYYHDYPIEVICERLGYSSDEVTRVTKMRCLKKLREIVAADRLELEYRLDRLD